MQPRDRITASEFLTWLTKQPGDVSYELLDGSVSRTETGTNIRSELIERISDVLAPIVRASGCRKYSGSLGFVCANGDVLATELGVVQNAIRR